ncbi:MAG: MMPL family transporter, partial [Thermoanaerobaculia bacterium]|nr:MMPL family transporter [Thermoanaerobaculia bacterium]
MSRRGLERLAVGWAVWVARRPWRVIAATLLLVAVAATGLPRLELSNSFRVYFSEENPERVAFEALEATYAKSDNILFVLRPAAGDVFTAETLASLERLTEAAWRLPWASRVDSPTNFQHSRAEGDELIVADLVRGAEKLDRRALARVRSTALAEPALAGLLVSPDGSTAGVNVVFQFPGASRSEVPEAVAAARELARQTEAGTPGIRVYLSGVALLDHAFADAGQRDGATLLPVMLGVVVLFLAVVLRSLSACLATLAVLGCATLSALGLAGHLGIRLTPVAMTAPTIILTLAVADGVHLFGTILSTRRRGASRRGALAEALRVNLVPVSVTSATTMVGFLALNFADTPPFRDLGNLTALGIGAAWAAALSLLPALAMKLPLPAPRGDGEGRWTRALDAWGAWVVRRPGFALAAVGALALGAGAGLTRLGLDD